jgi:aryl-alcohol dehydrogenase-like predicted oxidoreductase
MDSHRASRMPQRYDLSNPANADKLDRVEQLVAIADKAGVSMLDLALGFVLAHPAVTSAIIGPRTMEQLTSQLGGGDVVLDGATLDAIDAVVPPGVTVSSEDVGYLPPALASAWRRRRPAR